MVIQFHLKIGYVGVQGSIKVGKTNMRIVIYAILSTFVSLAFGISLCFFTLDPDVTGSRIYT